MTEKNTAYRWRPADPADIGVIYDIQCIAHDLQPEAQDVLLERLLLCPQGCFVLENDGVVSGYVLSHPWIRRSPPPVDARLGAIPVEADIWYLHDLALLPATRGSGAGAKVSALLAEQARQAGFTTVALVSVNGSQGFWERQGFSAHMDGALAGKLESYGGQAVYMERDVA
ncbi:GNAT family N-acetyltransferase [Rhizobium herbae]|uniref:Ribosomal protein S18 acetylase RimI-like enzyme n=1 Tax=Rhizobium herbae TaxID=508661 RepID=A0ABS4ELZ6_9HYPH|nr:GNAT family N-acetyltransferase [Rhizobium herbae]MBP1858973.1 ribosomal protein S18 acetylase RimI-like enzyme [Rhizobium herbae]